MKIVCLDGFTLNPGDNPWTAVEAQGELTVYERTPPELVVERARGADVVLTNKTVLDADTLAQLPDVKFIAVLATGYNVVDTAVARERGIPVSNVPIYGTDSVAQFVFALLLELCHRVGHHGERVRDGEWARRGDFCFWDTPLVELSGLTMGIVGFGRIGRRTAELAHAFGMSVLATDIQHGETPAYEPFAWCDVDQLFAQADVVSLHCPQTADNVGFVQRDLLASMKASAFLINTSRGPLVNEADLAAALNGGVIAGAAVDVVSSEPIAADNPLMTARNLIVTPHMAWGTLAARRRLMATTAENVRAFAAGAPVNVVN